MLNTYQTEAQTRNSTDANAAVKQAVALLKERRWTEAQVAHQKLVDWGINKAAGYYGLGVVAMMNGKTADAHRAFLNCVEHDPRNAHANFNLGIISEKDGEIDVARSWFLRAVKICPTYTDALEKLRSLASTSSESTDGRPEGRRATGRANGEQAMQQQSHDPRGFYAILKLDAASRSPSSVVSQNALALIDRLNGEFRPQSSAFRSKRIRNIILFPLWPLLSWLLRAKIRNTTYKFDQGRLQIDSCIFWRFRRTFELYRLTDMALYQTWLNRKTKDGTMLLVFHSPGLHLPAIVQLKGLEKIEIMERMLNDLRQLTVILRMHPLLKGIIN